MQNLLQKIKKELFILLIRLKLFKFNLKKKLNKKINFNLCSVNKKKIKLLKLNSF
jgi:hypothetical protein